MCIAPKYWAEKTVYMRCYIGYEVSLGTVPGAAYILSPKAAHGAALEGSWRDCLFSSSMVCA